MISGVATSRDTGDGGGLLLIINTMPPRCYSENMSYGLRIYGVEQRTHTGGGKVEGGSHNRWRVIGVQVGRVHNAKKKEANFNLRPR